MGWLPGTIELERGKVADYNMVPFFGWICMVVSLRWYKSSEQSRGSNHNMLVDYRGRLLMNNELVSALSNGSLRCKQHRQRWPLMGSASLFCLDLVWGGSKVQSISWMEKWGLHGVCGRMRMPLCWSKHTCSYFEVHLNTQLLWFDKFHLIIHRFGQCDVLVLLPHGVILTTPMILFLLHFPCYGTSIWMLPITPLLPMRYVAILNNFLLIYLIILFHCPFC